MGDDSRLQYEERNLVFLLEEEGKRRLNCTIFGKTDAAIAETAVFFWSLKHPEAVGTFLHVDTYKSFCFKCVCDSTFEFAALPAETLAQILDANLTRSVSFPSTNLSPEQSVILATRSYLLNLKRTVNHGGLGFKDGGRAFVEALKQRQSTFGSLEIACHTDAMIFDLSYMKHIMELGWMVNLLSIRFLSVDLVFLPFSAKVKALDCTIQAKFIQPENFDSLDIVPKDLELQIELDDSANWKDIFISLFKRMQRLGHFERWSFALQFSSLRLRRMNIDAVVPAFIDAIKGNANLKYLDLSRMQYHFNEDTTLLEAIFQAMEEHPGLRTVVLDHYPCNNSDAEHVDDDDDHNDDADDSPQRDFSSLERLLKRNRNITVCDHIGEKFTNKDSIDKLYALNRFYCGSAELVKKDTFLRPLLVATALAESASANYQYTALLLSHHTDMLCELLEGVDQDGFVVAESTDETVSHLSEDPRPHADR